MSHSRCLEGKEQGIEDKSKEQGRRLVTLLLAPREDHFGRPAVGQIRLVIRSRVEAPKQVDIGNIQLF